MNENTDEIRFEERVNLMNTNEVIHIYYKEDRATTEVSDINELKVSLTWTNLSYAIQERNTVADLLKLKFKEAFRSKQKVILHQQSGCLTTGTLMAIIGKSGSGKTTLLESLTGRRVKDVKGEITVNIRNNLYSFYDFSRLKIAFIPQKDCLLESLTIEESLLFASKIKNLNADRNTHAKNTSDLLQQFDLTNCKNVHIADCSSGEKKRLSIAMELVSKPTFLIVDEPTSGLDSSSALQCIQLLKKVALSVTNPVAILVSIHQPSTKIFNEFHKLYLLSHNGMCIYNGEVDQFLPHCAQFNLSCPPSDSVANFAVDVACGDYGKDAMQQMSEKQTLQSTIETKCQEKREKVPISSIQSSMNKHSLSDIFTQTALLSKRAMVSGCRQTDLMLLRLCTYLFLSLTLFLVYSKINKENGCIYRENNIDISMEKLRKLQASFQNLGFIFATIAFFQLAPMMTSVTKFPAEMCVFLKERTNGWYSCLAYYVAKTMTDLPFQLLCTTLYACVSYFFTGHPNEIWRFTIYLIISVLVTSIGESVGLIAGALYVENMTAAIFIAPISVTPFTLLSGFFVRNHFIPSLLRPITYISFFRYAFEAYILCLYGFSRCEIDSISANNTTLENESIITVILRFVNYISRLDLSYSNTRPILGALAVDKNQSLSELESFDVHFENFNLTHLKNLTRIQIANKSLILQEFGLEDDQLYYSIYMLCAILLFLRLFAYIVLYKKANKKD